MRENLTGENMAFTQCLRPAELFAERKGDKKKNWMNRITFLPNTDFSKLIFHLKKNRAYRPTACDGNQCVQSLDTVLNNKCGKAAFYIFLKSEFCEENIEFWTACEEFRQHTSREELASKAQSIYDEFIKNEAPREINLDFQTKKAIAQSLREPTATSFLAAQRKAYVLMENNSYPRFIHSDLYKQLYQARCGRMS